jgi:hypothetical protein
MSRAQPPFDAAALSARLEAARGVIETKFLKIGEMLSQAVDGIARLLSTMDTLTQALSPETGAATTRQLADTAARLSALPARQAERHGIISDLAAHRSGLSRSVEDMRRSLAYMRAFTVSIRIVAGGITRADQEFDVFAQEMSARAGSLPSRLAARLARSRHAGGAPGAAVQGDDPGGAGPVAGQCREHWPA